MFRHRKIWLCRRKARTRTSCASSRKSMAICAPAATARWDAGARTSTRRNRPDGKRPKMIAWDRMPMAMRRSRCWHLAALFGLLLAHRAAAQAPGLGASVELVDPKVFRVCADPSNLPFSDEQGEGFENKLAELFARKLNEPTNYTYYPQVIGFVRNTLNALRCDVIMGTAVGDTMVQTTNPYYRTTYALVFKPNSGLDGVESLGDSRLKDKH